MPTIDSGIYNALGVRPKSTSEYLADYDQQDLRKQAIQQNALALQTGQMAVADRERATQRQNALLGLTGSWRGDTTDDQRVNDLKNKGYFDEADKLQTQLLTRQKATSENSERELKLATERFSQYKKAAGSLFNAPNLNKAMVLSAVQELQLSGVLPPELAQGLTSRLPDDPTQLRGELQRAVAMQLSPEQMLTAFAPKVDKTDTGGAVKFIDTNPNSPTFGKEVAAPQTKVVSPDATLQAETTRRGQNMTDARAREAQAAAVSKPFEVTGPDGAPVLVQQDKSGNIRPVDGYAPKGAKDKPLPQAVLKQISEARDNAVTMERLSSSFKPEYAAKGILGVGADMQLAASGNLGADKNAVEWWKNYRKQAELVERHALFGAALTPTEQASWRSADISPGMHPDVVARNLATRNALAKKVLETTRQDLVDAGHSEKRVGSIAGRGAPQPPSTGGVPTDIADLLNKYGGK